MIFTYLALGDSYTMGEGVTIAESFPYQTVQLLRQTDAGAQSRREGFTDTPTAVANPVGDCQFAAPEIVANTGWTTDELTASIQQTTLFTRYNVVSLLIGVNNQYRGRSIAEFVVQFTGLLQKAIGFAGGESKNVFVLSIPDWSVTPFAQEKDREKIAAEVDDFNAVCKSMSAAFMCTYIDITTSQKQDGSDELYLAADGLHPSGKEYAKWAEKLKDAIMLSLF